MINILSTIIVTFFLIYMFFVVMGIIVIAIEAAINGFKTLFSNKCNCNCRKGK